MYRSKGLRNKIEERFKEIVEQKDKLSSFEALKIGEEAALGERLERLREEAQKVQRRERELQEDYRAVKQELLAVGGLNGHA